METIAYNIYYIAVEICIQISGIYYVRKLEFTSVALGIALIITSLGLQLLEFYQPQSIMRWILFWTSTWGRGVLLVFLSLVAINGSFIFGFIPLLMSVSILLSPIIFNSTSSPKSIYEICNVSVEERPKSFYGTVHDTISKLSVDTTED